MNKIIFFLVVLFGLSHTVFSQETDTSKQKIELDMGADLYSRYIWRGSQFGDNLPNIQPTISAKYRNVEFGFWGAYTLGGDNFSQEMDIYLTYSFLHDLFSVTVTDYYFPVDNGMPTYWWQEPVKHDYFEYEANKTEHILEGGISFNGTEKLPLSVSAYVNFYGNDAMTIGSNPNDYKTFNQKTGIQYSNYLELAYKMTVSHIDVTVFVGSTFNSPKKQNEVTGFYGETGFYGDYPGVVNVGFSCEKSIEVTKKLTIPSTTTFVVNPETKKVYLVFGISF